MRLLLDTHALIWWPIDSPRLSQAARTAITDPQCAVFATAVSGYEIAKQERLGRLPGKLTGILPDILRCALDSMTCIHGGSERAIFDRGWPDGWPSGAAP